MAYAATTSGLVKQIRSGAGIDDQLKSLKKVGEEDTLPPGPDAKRQFEGNLYGGGGSLV